MKELDTLVRDEKKNRVSDGGKKKTKTEETEE
jgi:hypothetical protein